MAKKMKDKKTAWVANVLAMECMNTENGIRVALTIENGEIIAKIASIPVEVLRDWAKCPDGMENIKKMNIEAKEVFARSYKEVLRYGTRKKILQQSSSKIGG